MAQNAQKENKEIAMGPYASGLTGHVRKPEIDSRVPKEGERGHCVLCDERLNKLIEIK